MVRLLTQNIFVLFGILTTKGLLLKFANYSLVKINKIKNTFDDVMIQNIPLSFDTSSFNAIMI